MVDTFSWPNGLWSLFLFALLIWVLWYKLHLLRMEIHNLVERLPKLGTEFIRKEIDEVKRDLDAVKARVRLCETRQGYNGDEKE